MCVGSGISDISILRKQSEHPMKQASQSDSSEDQRAQDHGGGGDGVAEHMSRVRLMCRSLFSYFKHGGGSFVQLGGTWHIKQSRFNTVSEVGISPPMNELGFFPVSKFGNVLTYSRLSYCGRIASAVVQLCNGPQKPVVIDLSLSFSLGFVGRRGFRGLQTLRQRTDCFCAFPPSFIMVGNPTCSFRFPHGFLIYAGNDCHGSDYKTEKFHSARFCEIPPNDKP